MFLANPLWNVLASFERELFVPICYLLIFFSVGWQTFEMHSNIVLAETLSRYKSKIENELTNRFTVPQ